MSTAQGKQPSITHKTKLGFESLTIGGGAKLLFIYTVQESGCLKYNPQYHFYHLSVVTIDI